MKETLSESIVSLKKKVKGKVIMPQDREYNETRQIWNAMIDRKPAVIVQCKDANDAVMALRYAKENDLDLSIRGAGHNIAGNSLCDNGLLIDFSTMKNVRVDAGKKKAYIEPGATLGDVDQACQPYGLAFPVGINSTTGIAGLTLGGGFGWLSRKYGMTIDSLASVDMVTAEGEKLHASNNENADLFWAVRGGGGNFGIVTQFEFNLNYIGTEVYAGLTVFPIAQAKQVLHKYRDFILSTPDEFNTWVVMRKAPPLPFLPESVHGTEVVIMATCYFGDSAHGEKLAAPIRDFGTPVGEHLGMVPYIGWQQAFDPLLTPGFRNYWKSHNFTHLQDGLFDAMIEYTGKLPSPHCEIFIGVVGGKMNEVPADATAYSARDMKFVMNVHGRWETQSEDEKCVSWSRNFFKASAPFASGGAYVNFMTEEENDRIKAAYGVNYERLAKLKAKYDPHNTFHMNQNIKP
ncbi:FAD-binding oxidoreductase [Mangrovibacterium diazotrophicum]|uniref:FAD/FMN-containing dehydrogenase n=1 Tax=Mangrovibacterium diazotrophicum TaxID=1261403 RepID=A0A419W912_9BACT|nr:FAD-binding oxidoreductase [Mangrovibacterium diazotrophicum]RKD91914.1 FAD/FMN-containing dehydrogenase [Mangrovibacterium diazotrophicum]